MRLKIAPTYPSLSSLNPTFHRFMSKTRGLCDHLFCVLNSKLVVWVCFRSAFSVAVGRQHLNLCVCSVFNRTSSSSASSSRMDCPTAINRLVISGVPATIEHRAAAASSASTSAAIVAECVQNFITAMDSLKLNMVAVD